MKIRGFRQLGPDEVIALNHWVYVRAIRTNIQIKGALYCNRWLGKTNRILLDKYGAFRRMPAYVAFEKNDDPIALGNVKQFDGWYPIGVDAPTLSDDVGVLVKKIKGRHEDFYDPNTSPLRCSTYKGRSMRSMFPGDTQVRNKAWCVYRRVGAIVRNERIPSCAYFSTPLPLP